MTTNPRRKVAIVTGAGSGVGRATALALAANGMAVALASRRSTPLDETAALIEEAGGTALPIATDVSSEASVDALIKHTATELGGVDVLICAAGVGLYGPVASYSFADWQTTLATNLTGVFLCARAALTPMQERGHGAIIAVGSGAGKQGYANLAAYSASKFGLLGFMQSLAAEVSKDGIKVSTILPGSILTDFAGGSADQKRANPDGKRYLEPEDVAQAISFLLAQPDRAWTQELNLWPF
ncbi:MAG TPA: SDR family NAD(P)-dependent oxidoreductase [Thermomicrobiales bacterium]|nr:SDR family NAD(P)-dependent oxidoreductase [Thermomicrobiales bacterium]